MTKVVTASYESRQDAEHAAERLIAAGLMRQEISMLAPDEGGTVSFAIEPRRRTLAGLGGGALLGLVVGAVCASILAMVPLSIPGLDLDQLPIDFAALGPIPAALAGAGAGAVLGALLGAVIGLGRTKHEAILRDIDHLRDSYVLLGVAVPPEMVRSAVNVMHTAGALSVKRR
jgi:hypothetical protein